MLLLLPHSHLGNAPRDRTWGIRRSLILALVIPQSNRHQTVLFTLVEKALDSLHSSCCVLSVIDLQSMLLQC